MDNVAKVFPQATELRAKIPSGVVVAALLSAMIGLLILGIVNIYSDADAAFSKAITLNSGIGPYSGKELFWLAGWFVSWAVLHLALRRRALSLRKWFGVFMVGMLVATLLMWPPIFGAIADALKGG